MRYLIIFLLFCTNSFAATIYETIICTDKKTLAVFKFSKIDKNKDKWCRHLTSPLNPPNSLSSDCGFGNRDLINITTVLNDSNWYTETKINRHTGEFTRKFVTNRTTDSYRGECKKESLSKRKF